MTLWQRFRYYTEMLSLDICAGVLGSGALAQVTLNARMPFAWWFLLPASVWVIYTADHLMDARKSGGQARNERHLFHYHHFRLLSFMAAMIAAVCLVGALVFFREIVFTGGLLVAALALLHILLAFWGKIRFGKELSVGIIYTCGVWFAPWLNRGAQPITYEPIFVALFLCAAWLNLFMNAVLEFDTDRADGQLFAMENLRRGAVRRYVIVAAFISALVAASLPLLFQSTGQPPRMAASAILACLCATPGIILLAERFFLQGKRYRLPAEWVFSLGLLLKL
ncbi:MAG: prenyltransferase [Spirochaetota bacterium]